jgi:carbon-monoxide dehydrogenase large subunit
VNAAVVEVDVETGKVAVRRYVVAHDSGRIVNPTIVDGQVQGAVAHGLGVALLEECVYDEEGRPTTATFADYLLPGAGDVPPVDTAHFETPSPFNPEGIKGVGEGGTIGAIPTLVSAIEDALSPFGIKLRDVPVRQEEIALTIAMGDSSP